MRRTLAASLYVLIAAAAIADGKMYGREEVPPGIPYQRALIHFRDGVETLILQSKYATELPNEEPSMGWVVPVPSEPEVASIHPMLADSLFSRLSMKTGPRVTRNRDIVFRVLICFTSAVAILSLILHVFLSVVTLPTRFGFDQQKLTRVTEYLFATSMVCFLFVFLLPVLQRSRGTKSVEVISEHTVGIYDVSLIRSGDSGELISWLNEHDFQFGEEDVGAFAAYIDDGWCFVVATIKTASNEDEWDLRSEGLAAPLVLRFPYEKPVYPLRLTGTGGFDTEVLVYLATDAKMMCDDRLALRFAGATESIGLDLETFSQRLRSDSILVEPEGFFKSGDMNCSYLCKFKATLTPAQMGQDLVFAPADDNSEFKEHLVEW